MHTSTDLLSECRDLRKSITILNCENILQLFFSYISALDLDLHFDFIHSQHLDLLENVVAKACNPH